MAERAGALPHLSARTRLLIALALAFGIAAVQRPDVLPPVAAIAALGLLLAPERRALLRRLRPAALLALAFLLVLPLMTGSTVLASVGPLSLYREGFEAGVLVATRLLAIVALSMALLAPVPAPDLVAALRGLGLPSLIADLALLTLRHLDETRAELRRAHLARQVRGGRARLRDLPDHAALLATSLIRAQARSERIWAAMRLRGHGAAPAAVLAPLRAPERMAIALAVVLALGLVVLDRGL